jgi:hypothetical protein
VATAIYLFGIIFYACFAHGELQSWAKIPPIKLEADAELNNIDLKAPESTPT